MRLHEGAGYLRQSVPVTRRQADTGLIQWVDSPVDVPTLWGPSVKSFAESLIVTGKRPSLMKPPEPGRRKRGRPPNSAKVAASAASTATRPPDSTSRDQRSARRLQRERNDPA
jgi:hypothetical protein